MTGKRAPGPTPRMTRVWEAFRRNGYNQHATGRELGMGQSAVRSAVVGYCRTTGTPLPATMGRNVGRPSLEERFVPMLSEILVRLADRDAAPELGEIVERLDRLEAKVDQVLRRPPYRILPVDHRRLSDGGQQVRHQIQAGLAGDD